MYNMNIKLLGYKCRLEVVVICVVLGIIIGSTMLCSCKGSAFENFAVGKNAAVYNESKGMSDGVHSEKWGDSINHYQMQHLNSGKNNKMFMWENNKFEPGCCDYSSVSGSNGCACVTEEQNTLLKNRGGNRTFNDGFN